MERVSLFTFAAFQPNEHLNLHGLIIICSSAVGSKKGLDDKTFNYMRIYLKGETFAACSKIMAKLLTMNVKKLSYLFPMVSFTQFGKEYSQCNHVASASIVRDRNLFQRDRDRNDT